MKIYFGQRKNKPLLCRKIYTRSRHGKLEVPVPISHCLMGTEICRVVFDRIDSKLID